MHEPLTNVRPVIFLTFARETPRSEVWRALHGAATLQAQCGRIVARSRGYRSDQYRCGVLVARLPHNLGEDLHVAPYKSGGHGPKSGPRESGFPRC